MGNPGSAFESGSVSVSLSTTDTVLTLGTVGDPVPDDRYLSLLRLALTSLSGSPVSISWFLAEDENGDIPLTPRKTTTIVTGKTTATKGAVAETLDVVRRRSSGGTLGRLYVVAKTNTGTCSAVAYLSGEQR